MKLRLTGILLFLCSWALGQTYSNTGVNSWQRAPTAKGYVYRANIAPNKPGYFYVYTQDQIDSLIAISTSSGVTSFNSRTGAITPLVVDYSAFYYPLSTNPAGYSTFTPSGTSSQYIKGDGTYGTYTGGVTSFNSRTGTVIPVAGDYASLTEILSHKDLTAGTNTFPTFNQNTTGSAASLTTPRTINGVSFNGTSNITITANNPYSLTNGYGLNTLSYDGSAAKVLVLDTASSNAPVSKSRLATNLTGYGALNGFQTWTNQNSYTAGLAVYNGGFVLGAGDISSYYLNFIADPALDHSQTLYLPSTGSFTVAYAATTLAGYGITDAALNSAVIHNTGSDTTTGDKVNSGIWSFGAVKSPTLYAGNTNLDGVSLAGFYNQNLNGNMLVGNNRSGSLAEIDFINAVGTSGSAIGGFRWSNVTTAGTEVPLFDINGSTKDITTYGRLFIGSIPSSASVANDYVTIDPISSVLVHRTAAQVLTDATVNRQGQVALSAGVATISISGVTTTSHAFVTLVSLLGTVTTTWQYRAVCTADTLTITALTNTGTTDTADASILNWFVIQ